MAFGPEKLLLPGTKKRKDIEAIERYIDEKIAETEGDEVYIHPTRLNSLYEYKNDIIHLYLRAGWKRVEWISTHTKVCDPHLLLSNK